MKSKYTLLAAALVIALGSTQCKKKSSDPATEDPAPTAPSGSSNISDVFAASGSQAQNVQVSGTTAQTITVNGVQIEIPGNAFLTSVGGAVTGTVGLTVKTILNKREIILSGAGANSAGAKLVATKGCVKITATQNSQSLRLNTGGGFVIDVSSPTNTTTASAKKLYAPKVTASDSTKFWSIENDTTSVPVTFSGGSYHYRASLDSLKWLNVGSQWDTTGSKTPVIVNLPSQFNKTNTVVYVSFNGSLTVGALFEVSANKFRIPNMPIGKGITFVVISIIDGQYYSAIMTDTIKPLPVSLSPVSVTYAQLLTQLTALP